MSITDRNRRRTAAVLAAVLLLLPAAGFGARQESPGEDRPYRINRVFLRNSADDLKAAWSAPLHWRGDDWTTFGLAAGATLALFALDRGVSDAVQSNASSLSKDASSFIRPFGQGAFQMLLLAGLYFGGELADDVSLRRTALVGLESFVAAAAVTSVLKFLFGRARPYAGESASSFHPFSTSTRHVSFVSGDAATAFALAAVIAEESRSGVLDAVVYGLAGLVAFYRVHDGKHWPSDVLAGSAIGYFIGRRIAALDRTRSETRFSIATAPLPGGASLTLSAQW